jgi:hypothetical protein
MHPLAIVAVIVLIAVVVLLGLAATKPAVFRVARSARVKAPPQALYPRVADFHRWTEWSPYEDIDAELKRSYSGEASGVGAVYGWEGRKTGAGRMEIIEASPDRHVGIKLDFMKPFTAHNVAEFTFEPVTDPVRGELTAVTWSMHGPAPFMSKLMSVFLNMDQMIGKDFEKGLLKLKTVAEG